ncbi:VID27 cytoplasmic protein-domain-containing protein [Entophlyctis helioformis]|nr:VID27 cytoplasmic protein-domain-containing protein [Entophlyctis helioformis]
MFLLRSLGNIVFGSADGNLIELPSGQLFFLDPSNPTATRSLVFRDARAAVRRTPSKHNYQLVVTRIFEEGEAELDDEAVDDDEHTFLIDSVLLLRNKPPAPVSAIAALSKPKMQLPSLIWADTTDDTGTCGWEFVPDAAATNDVTVQLFEEIVFTCMFERAHLKSKAEATDADLQAFVARVQRAAAESSVGVWRPPSAAAAAPAAPAAASVQTPVKGKGADARFATPGSVTSPQPMSVGPTAPSTPSPAGLSGLVGVPTSTAPLAAAAPAAVPAASPLSPPRGPHMPAVAAPAGSPILSVAAELFIYDGAKSEFLVVRDHVNVDILAAESFTYKLVVNDENGPYIVQNIDSHMNAVFSKEHLSFVWVWMDAQQRPTYSWSLRFPITGFEQYREFQRTLSQCMYNASSGGLFSAAKADDQQYIVDTYEDVEMADRDDEDEAEEEEAEEEEDAQNGVSSAAFGEPDAAPERGDTSKNSQLTVGYKHNRSFVVRGNRIGVFRHTDDDELQFATTIKNVGGLDGTTFSPRRVMLHEQDSSLLLMAPNDGQKVFKMDLERGKVVEEWKIDDDMDVTEILPETKYAQMTPSKTFVGMGRNAIFRVDPRLSGKKRVDSESYLYKAPRKFNVACTTGSGELAVASEKGDIGLYNKLNIRAKTSLPGLGDPIVGIDSTENGKFLLATCSNYLLLIDTEMGDGTSGYKKGMGSEKPVPKRLQLKPEHVAWIGEQVSFTPARFNTGEGLEKSIVTSTGPYVITWNFRRVKNGHLYDYKIKKYSENVVSDNFRYGADRSIIVALPENVEMVAQRTLQTPTKMLKSRSNVVNSPY